MAALAASAAMERGDKAQAVAHWEHLHRLLPPQSQTAARIAANLAEARGETPLPAKAAIGASVSGRVAISDKAPRRPAPNEAVFIYARPVDGSRMPLAVLRRQVRDLPLTFTLDDSLAMSAGHRLSSQQSVMLEARVSASGNAVSQPGDLIGRAGPVPVGSSAIELSIESMLAPQESKP
jgi:cytochrome c-type biogenesis protein CcmH